MVGRLNVMICRWLWNMLSPLLVASHPNGARIGDYRQSRAGIQTTGQCKHSIQQPVISISFCRAQLRDTP